MIICKHDYICIYIYIYKYMYIYIYMYMYIYIYIAIYIIYMCIYNIYIYHIYINIFSVKGLKCFELIFITCIHIHKRLFHVPGRPVIFWFLHWKYFLILRFSFTTFFQKDKSYIMDSNHFLRKIK